ncbi:hypothetical protein [Geminicoccus harenae]|uniref:hypothetical protein n=1 Tax=Geminicoccus harenae TaxID=2498453 RepID=UPI001C98942B|nr:hypothetical protein [Geminicoccus harenae]
MSRPQKANEENRHPGQNDEPVEHFHAVHLVSAPDQGLPEDVDVVPMEEQLSTLLYAPVPSPFLRDQESLEQDEGCVIDYHIHNALQGTCQFDEAEIGDIIVGGFARRSYLKA